MKRLLFSIAALSLIMETGSRSRTLPGSEALAKLPMSFEPGVEAGQFLARGRGYAMAFTGQGAAMRLRKRSGEEGELRLRMKGANPAPEGVGEQRLPGVSNYLIGNDPKQWRTGVAQYAKVRYREVYPGIDVVYYGNQKDVEYDFVVKPGADPRVIALAYEGADGLKVDRQGDLLVEMGGGTLRQQRPRVYQKTVLGEREVASRYVVEGPGEVRIAVDGYDAKQALVIDPTLSYSTYYGGTLNDVGYGIAVDGTGAAYVAGSTDSTNFPLVTGFGTAVPNKTKVFVMKLNASGSSVAYATYIGGDGVDTAYGIAVDAAGAAYVTGVTGSSNFPLLGPVQSANRGGNDAFVLKVLPTGQGLAYSTYLGGSGTDVGRAIAVDGNGNAYVTGSTTSMDFPTQTPRQATLGGSSDAFVTKISTQGSSLSYSTYLGGSGDDVGYGIAVDTTGQAHVTGTTTSGNFPTVAPAQLSNKGNGDAFVTKLTAAGTTLVYSTYLGGTQTDAAYAIAVDGTGAYVTGSTNSTDFPLVAPLQTILTKDLDLLLAKYDPAGVPVFSSFLGGVQADVGTGIKATATGIYVAGYTSSADFPAISQAVFPYAIGGEEGFVMKLNPSLSQVLYGTYLAGTKDERVLGLAVDGNGGAYVTGYSESSNYPTQSPIQGGNASTVTKSPRDVIVTKISDAGQDMFIPVTVRTSPENLNLTLNGATYNETQTRFYRPGATLTIGAPAVQPLVIKQGNLLITVNGSRYLFNNWTDNGAMSHTVTVTQLPVAYTAILRLQNQLQLAVTPSNGGTVVSAPTSADGFYDATTTVSITVTPNPGFTFAGWSDDTYGRQNPLSLLMDQARTLTAQFAVGQSQCAFTLSTQNLTIPADGSIEKDDLTTQAGCAWTATTSKTWINLSAASGVGNANLSFVFNPNSDALPRTGTIAVGQQYVQVLQHNTAPQVLFSDVPKSHPYLDYINMLLTNAITVGCGTGIYCPDATTTRGQMAAFLIRAIERTENFSYSPTPYFTDVPTTHPQFKYIQRMKERAITVGCSATTYCPDNPVTRGQMAVFIIRALTAQPGFTYPPFPSSPYFDDVGANHDYFTYIQRLRQLGVTAGCSPTLYCPDNPTTRGQMAVFIIRSFFTTF